jgi:hypothetical protein
MDLFAGLGGEGGGGLGGLLGGGGGGGKTTTAVATSTIGPRTSAIGGTDNNSLYVIAAIAAVALIAFALIFPRK